MLALRDCKAGSDTGSRPEIRTCVSSQAKRTGFKPCSHTFPQTRRKNTAAVPRLALQGAVPGAFDSNPSACNPSSQTPRCRTSRPSPGGACLVMTPKFPWTRDCARERPRSPVMFDSIDTSPTSVRERSRCKRDFSLDSSATLPDTWVWGSRRTSRAVSFDSSARSPMTSVCERSRCQSSFSFDSSATLPDTWVWGSSKTSQSRELRQLCEIAHDLCL